MSCIAQQWWFISQQGLSLDFNSVEKLTEVGALKFTEDGDTKNTEGTV